MDRAIGGPPFNPPQKFAYLLLPFLNVLKRAELTAQEDLPAEQFLGAQPCAVSST